MQRRGVEGLVLTEWKVANDAVTAARKIEEARAQADLYNEGPLAGIELRGYRYLILVSPQKLILPADATSGEIVYRHVNIAVQPETPSKAAPKIVRAARPSKRNPPLRQLTKKR